MRSDLIDSPACSAETPAHSPALPDGRRPALRQNGKSPEVTGHPDGFQTIHLATGEIPADLKLAWQAMRTANPHLHHPYFAPAFTEFAARSRKDTWLSVRYRNGSPVAILSCHRLDNGELLPIGGAINDYHGVIARTAEDCDLPGHLKSLAARRFSFHSWSWPIPAVAAWSVCTDILDTAAEIDRPGYLTELPLQSITIRKQGQKSRKMIRDLGRLRLDFDDRSPESLEWLIGLKREKYRRTGCTDFFQQAWTRELLAAIHQSDSPDLRGVLSILYVGDHRVAAHFGMISRGILHYWYPAFDRRFDCYSPGTELYLQIVAQALGEGVRRVDFGYGNELFKTKLANRTGKLACGVVGASTVELSLRRACYHLRQQVQQSKYRNLIRSAVRAVWPSAAKPVVR